MIDHKNPFLFKHTTGPWINYLGKCLKTYAAIEDELTKSAIIRHNAR